MARGAQRPGRRGQQPDDGRRRGGRTSAVSARAGRQKGRPQDRRNARNGAGKSLYGEGSKTGMRPFLMRYSWRAESGKRLKSSWREGGREGECASRVSRKVCVRDAGYKTIGEPEDSRLGLNRGYEMARSTERERDTTRVKTLQTPARRAALLRRSRSPGTSSRLIRLLACPSAF